MKILIVGIPEASGPCGSIRLVKVVSPKPARAHNLSSGPKIDNKKKIKKEQIDTNVNKHKN